ncbi:MAG: N-succinylarginine dihydrolase [Planctomycetes bacterium]|nr:N-succinylarginine dihydrolase [Planctomycetota bacterium]
MNDPDAIEVNFDGLVGPTHNYAGLALGNTASTRHRGATSSPRHAALEALAKMKMLMDLGVQQAVLPPQDRPDVSLLRRLGFAGSDSDVLAAARRDALRLLAAAASASSMWAANAGTVSPSADSGDGRLHLTPANLLHNLHRAIEAPTTTAAFRAIFHDESLFAVHDPLPAAHALCDEGAANHTRLCNQHGSAGIELFVYDRLGIDDADAPATRFPRRQTREACEAVVRCHRLDPARTVFARQNPDAIDAGVFHNDVIAVGHRNVLLLHARAFVDQGTVIDELRRRFTATCGGELHVIQIGDDEIGVEEAVRSYLFNSQLVTLPDGSMAIIAPSECGETPRARAVFERITAGGPIRSFRLVNVRQSMRNGGGPACLRLRVVMTARERAAAHQGVFLTDTLYAALTGWVNRHYREELNPEELADPRLLEESRAALDQLAEILGLGRLYAFQH